MPLLFSAQLHPALAPFRHDLQIPEAGRLEGVALASLLRDVSETVALPELARHEPERRWWTRLALTDAVEIWLLGWSPGQRTGAHDHGGAHGALSVVSGTLSEQIFSPVTGSRIANRTHIAGTSALFAQDHAHDLGADSIAVSVHAYSPPLRPTRPLVLG